MNCLQNICSTHQPVSTSPEEERIVSLQREVITGVVKSSLLEIAATSLSVALTCVFVVTPGTQLFFIGCAVSILFVNIILKSVSAYAHYRSVLLRESDVPGERNRAKRYEFVSFITSGVTPLLFGALYAYTADVVVHEAGHAFTANLFFQNARPSISVDVGSGVTHYFNSHLTSFGERIGRKSALALVSASGALFTLLTTVIFIVVAYLLKNRYPTVSKYLLAMAVFSTINSAYYALSALTGPSFVGHDFVSLAAAGIHPLVSFTVIVLVPLLTIGALYLCHSLQNSNN